MRISDWSSDVCSSDLPDHQCEQGFHYGASGWVVARGDSCRCARIDWCASAVRISRVAPTTTISTPRSKKVALGRCTSPIHGRFARSEEHTSELQSLMSNSYAVYCLKKNKSSELH